MKQKHLLLGLLFISLQSFGSELTTLRFMSGGQLHEQLVDQNACDAFMAATIRRAKSKCFTDKIAESIRNGHLAEATPLKITLPKQRRKTAELLDRACEEFKFNRVKKRETLQIAAKINKIQTTRLTRQMVENIKHGRRTTQLTPATESMLRILLTNKFEFADTYAYLLNPKEQDILVELYCRSNNEHYNN